MLEKENSKSFSLTLSVGHLELSSEQLISLERGMVFPLEQKVDHLHVALEIAGSLVAKGKLVFEGKELFFKITSISAENSAT